MRKESKNLEQPAEAAREGDRAALEAVVCGIQDRVYGLALRMLWHPQDAEDATQEILIRVVTNLGTFRGESAFTTWVYRLAANYLLTTRKRRMEEAKRTFEIFAADLDDGLSEIGLSNAPLPITPDADRALLLEEVKIGCTQGMLLCLDREHRLAYILGEILEISDREGGAILEISPAAFRKRLQRARETVEAFTRRKCGILNASNPCRCARRVNRAIELGRVNPDRLLFAEHPTRKPRSPAIVKRVPIIESVAIRESVKEMQEIRSAAALFRSHPDYAAPDRFLENMKSLLDSGKFKVLGEPS